MNLASKPEPIMKALKRSGILGLALSAHRHGITIEDILLDSSKWQSFRTTRGQLLVIEKNLFDYKSSVIQSGFEGIYAQLAKKENE